MSMDCISGGHPPGWWDHHKTLIFSIEHFSRRKGFDPTAEIKMFDDKNLSSLDCDINIRGVMDWGARCRLGCRASQRDIHRDG